MFKIYLDAEKLQKAVACETCDSCITSPFSVPNGGTKMAPRLMDPALII